MKHAIPLACLVAAFAVLGAGCSTSPAPSAAPSGSNPQAAAPAPSPVAMGNCDNPYYPLKAGDKITYASHSTGHDSQFSLTVTAATANDAKLTYHFDPNLDVNADITCSPDGLSATTFLNLSSAMSGAQVSAKTLSSSGQLIPRDLQAGTVWSNGYVVETQNNIPHAAELGMATSQMTVSTTNTAIGEESVTVPAGTFSAMKVDSKMHMHMTLGPKMPAVDTDTETISWYVKGKGLVKSTTDLGHGNSSSLEATSIVTP